MNDDRRNAIVRLLEIRYEHIPTPVRRSEISSGFVHGLDPKGQPWRWLSCPDCLTNDRTMFGCETCGGRGRIPDPGRDPMSESKAVMPFGADGSRHDMAYARDRQIERLAQQTRLARDVDEEADANARGYAWEEARKRLYATYHLAELDRALDHLHRSHPGWSPYSDRGLDYLSERLPDPLRAPGAEPPVQLATGRVARAAGAEALSRRDEEICRAIDAAIPTVDVAQTWGISVSQVNKIVRGRAA